MDRYQVEKCTLKGLYDQFRILQIHSSLWVFSPICTTIFSHFVSSATWPDSARPPDHQENNPEIRRFFTVLNQKKPFLKNVIKIGRSLSGKARKTANFYPALSFPSVHFVVLSRLSVVVVVVVVEGAYFSSCLLFTVASHRIEQKPSPGVSPCIVSSFTFSFSFWPVTRLHHVLVRGDPPSLCIRYTMGDGAVASTIWCAYQSYP